VLGEGLARQILGTGVVIGLVSLAAALVAQARGEHVQTWVFLTLGLAQLGVALALRAPRGTAGWRGRGLEAAVAVAALLQVAGVWVPALRHLLETEPVAGPDLLLLLGLSMVPGLTVWLERLIRHRR
jgi:Ca2+-transporting ATPase